MPGAGKTNTMLYLVTTLWRDTKQHVPFLVLEPAKQEYRALAMIDGMQDLCVFSPGADTHFPLHINPFQFPVGLTLAEHIANLNTVFAGAFELIPPSPFLIDGCIEKVYLDKGWNINERNDGTKEYPTMQELYDSLKVAVEESGYEGESKANIRSVMEVRIGSLLRREIGNVYNVRQSSMEPEDWLSRPVIIELESLGEGPANFMSLLISTLIREVLKIRKTSDVSKDQERSLKREIEHIIFYEEAHNLIGPTTDDPVGGSVDPKISATKYLVKMLAEVRALGEGIVIADQLPTAMAPEVLKNTGLKLGHRITAQDDRNLLGSTMSASADQLEEQGTFGTGQALIFYENLLKPFKMRVCEWEKGASQKKYDSPTNLQLFEHLKDNVTYNALLTRSASIMQEKMRAEFDVQRRQAETIKADINKKYAEMTTISGNLVVLEKKLLRLSDAGDIAETKKHIADLKRAYDKKVSEFNGAITRDLKKICWGFANLYFAYMTLSKKTDTSSSGSNNSGSPSRGQREKQLAQETELEFDGIGIDGLIRNAAFRATKEVSSYALARKDIDHFHKNEMLYSYDDMSNNPQLSFVDPRSIFGLNIGDKKAFWNYKGSESKDRYMELVNEINTVKLFHNIKNMSYEQIAQLGGTLGACAQYYFLDNAIRVEKVGNAYIFQGDGRHRLQAAIEAGIDKVPIMIVGEHSIKPRINGIKQGNRMSFAQADSGNVNPKYGIDIGYSKNCQSCVVVFEARLRGYNVRVLPNKKGSVLETLSRNCNWAWIDPKTGKSPDYIFDSSLSTADEYLNFVRDKVVQENRYTIQFAWRGRGNCGHIVNLDRTEDGKLRIKDNQRGVGERSEWVGDAEVLEYLSKMKYYDYNLLGNKYSCVPKLLRIDNMDFNPDVVDYIMEGRDDE